MMGFEPHNVTRTKCAHGGVRIRHFEASFFDFPSPHVAPVMPRRQSRKPNAELGSTNVGCFVKPPEQFVAPGKEACV
jgi:hypothetical protein